MILLYDHSGKFKLINTFQLFYYHFHIPNTASHVHSKTWEKPGDEAMLLICTCIDIISNIAKFVGQ